MSYMVMECHPGYAILLDEEGRFIKAANLHYEVGQRVYDPILMREKPAERQRVRRWLNSGIAAIAACFLLLLGFQYYQSYLACYSTIYLSINPAVQMGLNRQGTVVEVQGINEDGIRLLDGYDGKGKDKTTVADELIDRAIQMGFLSEGGQISFSIDTPEDELFQAYGVELRTEVMRHLEGRMSVRVEILDHRAGEQVDRPENIPASVPQEAIPEPTPLPEVTVPATPSIPDAPNYRDNDYSVSDYGSTDYGSTDYGSTDYGSSDYGSTDYGSTDYGSSDYSDTDYRPERSGS